MGNEALLRAVIAFIRAFCSVLSTIWLLSLVRYSHKFGQIASHSERCFPSRDIRAGDLLSREMYGHIHMMKTRPMPLNMIEELYMDALRQGVIYCVPAGIHDWAVNALKVAASGEEKMSALSTLLKVCTVEGNFLEGLNAVDQLISEPAMSEYRSHLLFQAGEMSVGLCDFNAAIGYYCRSLACAIRPEDLHPVILSRLGFCWLYKQDFKTAEECCRQAIQFGPHSWDAWKNLGVSLEHQGRIEEAFLAYLKAVVLSRGRAVPVLHLTRLSQRHSGKVPDVSGLRPTVYREYEVIL